MIQERWARKKKLHKWLAMGYRHVVRDNAKVTRGTEDRMEYLISIDKSEPKPVVVEKPRKPGRPKAK